MLAYKITNFKQQNEPKNENLRTYNHVMEDKWKEHQDTLHIGNINCWNQIQEKCCIFKEQ
jgi:hypothetical protein